MAYYYTLDNEYYFLRWSVGAAFEGCSRLPDGVAVPEPLQTCSCNVRAYKYVNMQIIYDPERADVSDLYEPAVGGGTAGKDGVSCTHEWDGTTLIVTSASGTSSADLKGERGDAGDRGAAGSDGVSCTHSWNGTTLIVTSASGTSSADLKGAKGDSGNIDPTKPLIIGDRVFGCLSYHDNDTKDQFVIKTKIPFVPTGTSSNGMPMLHVTGGAYGVQKIIDFKVYWYVYQSRFHYAVGCNNGTWKPQYVYLSTYTEGGVKYVALSIKLSAGVYIIDFTVDAYIGKLQQYYTENDFQGWSVDAASGSSIIPQSDIITVSGVS